MPERTPCARQASPQVETQDDGRSSRRGRFVWSYRGNQSRRSPSRRRMVRRRTTGFRVNKTTALISKTITAAAASAAEILPHSTQVGTARIPRSSAQIRTVDAHFFGTTYRTEDRPPSRLLDALVSRRPFISSHCPRVDAECAPRGADGAAACSTRKEIRMANGAAAGHQAFPGPTQPLRDPARGRRRSIPGIGSPTTATRSSAASTLASLSGSTCIRVLATSDPRQPSRTPQNVEETVVRTAAQFAPLRRSRSELASWHASLLGARGCGSAYLSSSVPRYRICASPQHR